MAIGASHLDISQAAAELWEFLAWNLRCEIFTHPDFHHPAELWVFQALLLLELFESMSSTKALHENAHVHHETTITLMRRSDFLCGVKPSELPKDSTPFQQWQQWLTNETTRRVAFAAFVMDSTHAAMFGHSAVMVVHEMRLRLPCDEVQWSSSSIKAIENTAKFSEGLQMMLGGQKVKTSLFGRTALIAGLLNMSWHESQSDLQVNALCTSKTLVAQDKWKVSIRRGFKLWKKECDNSFDGSLGLHTMLYHLAHMATYADIVHCQIFAGAGEVLGSRVIPQDSNTSQRYIYDWARTARARHATWHALQLLRSVLMPKKSDPAEHFIQSEKSLNRPWVIYNAALILWSYGYAREGPTRAPIRQADDFEQVRDMQNYLQNLGAAKSPDEFEIMKGFNGCSGMLMVLCQVFENMRWELMREAALILRNCIQVLEGES
jgi:hypothetical protein